MTTIVGDWGRKILVSDSQFSDDDTGIKYFDEKIVKIDGAMAAEVCMRMGLTAEEAVKWACNVDLKSHEPIQTYNL
jgi:hypothetical protein